MSKVLDALGTHLNVLILLSATLLTVGAYFQKDRYAYTRTEHVVDRIATAFPRFVGEVEADATARYRRVLKDLPIAGRVPSAQVAALLGARFVPATIDLGDGQRTWFEVLGDNDMTLARMLDLSLSNGRRATYSLWEPDAASLVASLQAMAG